MPDLDRTPTPGRSSAHKAQGRKPVPDQRDPGEGVDPPTIRSGSPLNPISGSGSSTNRRSGEAIQPEVPPLPVPGERIGDFGLEEAIGAGGMGAVFRAVDIKLDRQVAIKILPPDQAVDPDVVQRYYQEGRAAARLDHENIARVYSIGHDGRYHYIAFEYIEGTTIRQRVEAGGPLLVGDAINYTLQIANALVHSSARGVVHRDIKPSNIIVTPEGRAKLVDMGLARRFERGEDTGLTQSGMTLGTFDYISPEQARDPRDVDVRGDLYSLGCTLFHMLSGRPPFPEGTVLQKLLQHQEEPPPDIRKLNSAVPDDLAGILVKLMAKDRDRRYQTPEQLVRDLLTIAGSLGLRSLNPEGLVWMSPSPRPAPPWARQLVWGVPALAFLLILGVMAWWGEGPAPQGSLTSDSVPTLPPSKPPKPDPSPVSTPKTPAPEAPREYEVYSRENLQRMIAEAPPRSTIILADKGPYEIQGGKSNPFKGLDLTIRAEADVRPVIRLARDPDAPEGSTSTALIDLVGGRVTFDGIDFLIEGDDPQAAIRAEDAELFVRRCNFRRLVASTSFRSKPAAIVTRATSRPASGPSTDRGGSLWVDSSEFEGGQVAVSASGPVEVNIRDCTFGPALADQAMIWAENPESNAGAAEFRLGHVSVLAGAGPVFRFSGIAPRVWVRESAFAPPTLDSPSPILVALDSPDRLEWRGTDNLYGKFGSYTQPLRGPSLRGSIRTYDTWADDASFHEAGSFSTERHPWEEPNPLEALAHGIPRASRAFRLALSPQAPPRVGARQGPAGPLPPPVVLATAPTEPSTPAEPDPSERLPRPLADPNRSREVASASSPPASKAKPPSVDSEDSVRTMPLTLPTPKATREADPDAPPGAGELTPMPMPIDPDRAQTPPPSTIPSPLGPPKLGSNPLVAPAVEGNVIHTAEDFREALGRSGPGTKTLVIPADADWTLPACRVRGMSSWVIQAERGTSRPRLRFRPEASTSVAGETWSAWMTIQASGLRLEGVDLVLPAPEAEPLAGAPASRRRAVFAIAPGTIDLALIDCTVTIEGDSTPSAVVALLAGELGGEGRLRIEDCLIRVGGDLVDVAGGRRLDLEVDNAVIATGGPMVHGHGLPEGRTTEGLKLVLRQVTARVLGGLAQLQAVPGESELPIASINARDVVLTTGSSDAPLLRLDGQGDLENLRNLVRWEGHTVAYHLINIYRRDQSAQPGAVPTLYDRDFWNLRIGEREESPIHGDLKFPNEWTQGRRPWTLRHDDLRLPPDSPAVGADLRDIPNPPANRS
jgi:eukaryotic-like serine/threonine-protein kinase